jgi:hypothetical protein
MYEQIGCIIRAPSDASALFDAYNLSLFAVISASFCHPYILKTLPPNRRHSDKFIQLAGSKPASATVSVREKIHRQVAYFQMFLMNPSGAREYNQASLFCQLLLAQLRQ